jgi:hypothetical protein
LFWNTLGLYFILFVWETQFHTKKRSNYDFGYFNLIFFERRQGKRFGIEQSKHFLNLNCS